jgi:hypothetical protein
MHRSIIRGSSLIGEHCRDFGMQWPSHPSSDGRWRVSSSPRLALSCRLRQFLYHSIVLLRPVGKSVAAWKPKRVFALLTSRQRLGHVRAILTGDAGGRCSFQGENLSLGSCCQRLDAAAAPGDGRERDGTLTGRPAVCSSMVSADSLVNVGTLMIRANGVCDPAGAERP